MKKAQNGSLNGVCTIPASKSHTIRALIIATFAEGESRLRHCLESGDTLSCRRFAECLGAKIHTEGPDWLVKGVGSHPGMHNVRVDAGNSGTTLYLASAMAALGKDTVFFDGDNQIRHRSAKPLLDALAAMGAQVKSQDGLAPFSIQGPVQPAEIRLHCPVSQYLSALLLATPLIQWPPTEEVPGKQSRKQKAVRRSSSEITPKTTIYVEELNEQPYVELTLDWLEKMGINYERDGWKVFHVPCNQHYRAFDMMIPGDWSSAAFIMAGAALTGGEVLMQGLDMEDSQGDKAVLDMFERMGCRWRATKDGVWICGGKLQGITQDMNATPDALPAMAVAACFARGESLLLNVPQARMKETDRIAVMCKLLRTLGGDVRELEDGLVIRGKPDGLGEGGRVMIDGHGDHRVVMALAVLGLRFRGELWIRDAEAAEITFPGFFDTLEVLIDGSGRYA